MTWFIIGLILLLGGKLLLSAAGAGRPRDDHLYLQLEVQFSGDRTLIVQTLETLSSEMQRVIEARPDSQSANATASLASGLKSENTLTVIRDLSRRVASAVRNAHLQFDQAVSARGSPQMFCDAYAYLFGEIKEAERDMAAGYVPLSHPATASAFRALLRSISQQLAAWPRILAADAKTVSGQRYHRTLSVSVDMMPYQSALNAEADLAAR